MSKPRSNRRVAAPEFETQTPTNGAGVEPSANSLDSKQRLPRRQPYFLDNLRSALCMRCGYQWTPKVEYNHTAEEWIQDMPKKCPQCTSLHWDKPADRTQWDKRFKRNFDDGG